MNVKSVLQLTRTHTAPLEIVPTVLGAALAVGEIWSIEVAMWGVLGLLYHLAGYGQNSYADWEGGYDKNDPYKQHHPLNTGVLSPKTAEILVTALFILSLAYGSILAYPSIPGGALLVTAAISGVIYNYLGKRSVFKFVFIAIAHTCIFAMPYVSLGGEISSRVFLTGCLFVFLWVVFQISISGEIKDLISKDEKNLLRDIFGHGARTYNGENDIVVIFGAGIQIYALLVKGTTLALGLFIMRMIGTQGYIYPISLFLFSVGAVAATVSLLTSGNYERQTRIRNMAFVELFTMSVFIVAFWGLIGTVAVVTLMVGSLIWVLTFNRLEWGTWLSPEV